MQKNLISTKQAIYILIMFILGNSVMYTGSKAKQDTWLAVIIALVLFAPMMMVYARIVSLYPGKNLYAIVIDVFGNFFGKAIISLYVLYAISLGSLLMRNFSEFIHVVAMSETPKIVPLVFLFTLSVWMIKSGVETLGRWVRVALPVVFVSLLVTLFLSVKSMDFSNLKPVAGTEFNILMGSAFTIFSFPFAETVLFTTLFGSVKADSNPYKIYIYGIVICTLFFLAAGLRNAVIGLSLGMFYFASYAAVSVISLGEFFTRIEVLIGLAFLLDLFVKLCVCMFAASMGISKIVNIKNYKELAIPVGLLMMTLAIILFANILEMYDWLDIYKYFALPFQVILPLIILAGAEIKTRLK
ncbi:GerAB/ArcD/ProY family transporter [Dehalobacter restrictus]|jgi:spore germination protein KB|uniref:Spore germination protein n=1 Tax=Dehalobacter restrictus (strain DSM 9455 / PER-K23) TaxID=871738 RepID=A0ABM5P498_DEHRP|nr:endospore germination permease [Dehalobacter restrictus]AHF09347.1 spore germination protein [Dehalobacter restrictus DSM 9455]